MKGYGIEDDWQYENTKQIVARFATELDATVGIPLPDDPNRRIALEVGRAAARGFMYTLQNQLRYYEARRGAYLGHPGVPETSHNWRTPAA